MDKIILASKSEVRKNILNSNGISCEVIPSNVDEDAVKILLSSKIFFLTLLFEARIILTIIFIYFVYLYN